MRIERTKNAAKGITAGLLLRILQTVLPFLMRTAMIRLMGVEYLGLNGLFTSILHILNLAELGVGAAMVFSMYRPIAEDDETTICALMRLYRRYYRLIGLVVGAMGLALMPVLPKLISGEIPPELDIYVLYLLNLGSTVLTYWLFAYKNCLLQAHQRTDVASLITMLTSLVQTVLQFAVLFLTRNYYWYVIVAMATQALNNVCTAAVATKMYPRYRPEGKLSRAQTRAINGRIRDLFTGKLGSVVLSSSDTVVISAFLGLAVLAVYQNYFFIVTSVISVIEIMLQSVMAGLGNSFITEVKEKNYRDFRKFTFIYLWLVGVCTCCFLGLYQPFMKIWVGEELMLGFSAVICFAVYFFLCALNRLLNIYKDAAGLWHEDRFRPLVTSLTNLALNLLCVRRLGIYGVLLSTVVSMVVVGMPWVLHNVFTLFFDRKQLKAYVCQILGHVLATVAAGLAVCMLCSLVSVNLWANLGLCAVISATVPNVVFLLLLRRSSQFEPGIQFVDRLTKGKLALERRLLRRQK